MQIAHGLHEKTRSKQQIELSPVNIEVIQKPRAEFLGNVDLRNDTCVYGVGDFAGANNILNGDGIYRTIKQLIKLCKELAS